jgi:hypothetical protein
MSIHPLFAVMANVPQDKINQQINTGFIEPGGLYSDNLIQPYQVKEAYNEQIVKAGLAQPSPFSEAFLSTQNVEYIRQQIQQSIREYTEDPHVYFILTKEFAQDMIDRTYNNQMLAWDPKVGVPLMNDIVINREVEIAKLSQRHVKRYTRWALHNDRTRVAPWGIGDKTNHVHGENQVSPAGYQLNSPFQNQYRAYLRDVLKITCPKLSSAPCKMPPFPIKFASP